MSQTKIFVYGSLSEGMVHFDKIQNFVVKSEPGVIQGDLYRLPVGYPVVLQGGSTPIQGTLMELNSSDLLIQLLDEFHGYNVLDEKKSLYFRETVPVTLEDGSATEALVYYLNPKKLPRSAQKIEDGNWLRSLEESPVVTERLTEKQKRYIKKLGQSKGREIVPIDLGLYRELMNMEIIVDKGRRLALSKFGKEVYRYLD